MPVQRAHDDPVKVAVAAERERCAQVALKVCREIGAAPGSSIDSTCAQIHREIIFPQDV